MTRTTCFRARTDKGVHTSSDKIGISRHPQFIFHFDFSLSITDESSQNLCSSSTKAFCDKVRHERSSLFTS